MRTTAGRWGLAVATETLAACAHGGETPGRAGPGAAQRAVYRAAQKTFTAKLNPMGPGAFSILQRHLPGDIMNTAIERLTQIWLKTFGESPVVIDAELMRRVLADLGGAFGDDTRACGVA